MKIAKRILVCAVFALVLVSTVNGFYVPPVYCQSQEITYVASKNSKTYHVSSCSHAKKIKAENLISFSDKEKAVKEGYQPCKICKP